MTLVFPLSFSVLTRAVPSVYVSLPMLIACLLVVMFLSPSLSDGIITLHLSLLVAFLKQGRHVSQCLENCSVLDEIKGLLIVHKNHAEWNVVLRGLF